MADGVKVDEGKGPTIAADEVGGQQVQRVKVQHGADGSATDVSSASPLPIGDAGGSLTVDAPSLGGTEDAEASGNGSIVGLLKRLRTLFAGGLPAALTGSGNLKVAVQENTLAAPLPVRLSDGSEGIGTTSKRLHVDDGGSSLSVDDGGGSLTVDGSVSVGSPLPAGTNSIGQTDPRGNKAHDEPDTGNPIKTGGRARTALPAAVAQDDRSDFTADKHGRQLVTEYPRDQKGEGRLNLTNATETTILEAPGESVRWVVTGIIVTNSSASVETKVEIKDDTTAKVIIHAGTKGGGAAPACPPGGFFIGTANKTVKVKCVTTGADVEVFVCGYKIPA